MIHKRDMHFYAQPSFVKRYGMKNGKVRYKTCFSWCSLVSSQWKCKLAE